MKRPQQLSLDGIRWTTGRGGPRKGSGRPARRKSIVHHIRRAPLRRDRPVHVTLRVREDVPSLRDRGFVRAFQRSLAVACERGNFRVVHYSIQRNHLHLIVEAAGRSAMASGMKSVSIRLAQAINRVFQRRGPVLDGRYHMRVLETPREVRNALAYVLLNVRKHWRQRKGAPPPDVSASRPREVAVPHTWLLQKGWRRHGRIDPAEVPGGRR